MSELRDARFKKALDHAPDAEARPDERIRQAILLRARDAVAPEPGKPWWKKLWPATGSQRMPWNAALATLVVATLVTIVWHDREMPDPRGDIARSGSTVQPDPAVRASVPAPAPAPLAADTKGPQGPKAELQAGAPTSGPSARQARKAAPETAEAISRPPVAEPPPAEARSERQMPSSPGLQRDRAAGDLARGAAQDAAPAPSATPPSAAPPPMMRAAPSARLAAERQVSLAGPATHLVITGQGRRVEAPLQRPSRLADLIDRVIADASNAQTLEPPVNLRVELRREGELLGTLELAGTQARWTPSRASAGEAKMARPQAVLLDALRDELERMLR